MININKHTVQIGTGDVDVNILTSPGGNPILAFTEKGKDPTPANSIFLGFTSGESIDEFVSVLKVVRKKYYKGLDETQQFRVYMGDE